MTSLLITVRFLDGRYHGLLDRGGPPEWPPSPFRLFQAMVAGVAQRGELVEGEDRPENTNFKPIGQALGWLQRRTREHPPLIIAPKSKFGQGIMRYGPDNDRDDEKFQRNPEQFRTGKHTELTLFLLESGQKSEVHYIWDITGKSDWPVDNIARAARSLTTLGWGIDMAFADARLADQEELQQLKGVRWYPKKHAGSFRTTLRTPTYDDQTGECTLCDLRHCHSTFINRIQHGKPLKTVDKPKVFDRVLYTSVERPIGRPYAVFRLVDEEGEPVRYSHGKLVHIAGMVRHLAIERMKRNPPRERELRGLAPEAWVRAYVAGHQSAEDKAANRPHMQFSYVPLQSIGIVHTDPAARRVMIVAPLGDEDWLEHLATHLDGQELKPLPNTTIPDGTRLERIPDRSRDGVRDMYTRESRDWASVTPVILPGHDDHKPEKTIKLIQKALAQSGIDQPCEFEWSAFSYFRKSLAAHRYRKDPNDPTRKILINYVRPTHLLEQTAVHLTLRFGHREDPNDPQSRWIPAEIPVPGPIAIGPGRHCGFGVMAAIDES